MALHGVCQLAALHETGRTGQLTQRKGEDSDEGLEPDEEKRADEGGVLGAVAATISGSARGSASGRDGAGVEDHHPTC